MIAVPYFGDDPRFLKLLGLWWEHYMSSGTTIPAIIISDMETECPAQYPCLRIDTFPAREAMRGHAFDRKGAIVICAAQMLGNFLAVDMDAFVLRDPRKCLELLAGVPLAMAGDGWSRTITLEWHDYAVITQRQAGVIWFGAGDRGKLLTDYVQMFTRLGRTHGDEPLLEQFAWSGLWHVMGRHNLVRELNWEHCHDGESGREKAVIFHEHGQEKWKRL